MSTPTPDNITLIALKHYVSIYPQVVERYYKAKVKDPKKLKIALDNEEWRFNELPPSLKKSKKGSLTKEQLERLMQWKITHGKSRPFLPAQIRKNDPAAVTTHTAQAVALLKPGSHDLQTTLSALTAVCALTGVGPATGSLVLSVFAPESVPFFQDEMYAWLFQPGGEKLKYDRKEYAALVGKVEELRDRLGKDGVTAVEVEKAGFVVGHWDLVQESERDVVQAGTEDTAPKEVQVVKQGTKRAGKGESEPDKDSSQRKAKRKKT